MEAEEARDGTWNPPSREQARPDHAFRAAIQGALDAHGVAERILDHLVGHQPKSTRSKHYVAPAVEQLRRAVDLIRRSTGRTRATTWCGWIPGGGGWRECRRWSAGYGRRMIGQPDFSQYRMRFTSVVPLDRRHAEPDEEAFDRFDVELLRLGDDEVGEEVRVATAIAFRIRWEARSDLADAADSEPSSPLLEDVCLNALDESGEMSEKVLRAFDGVVVGTNVLVLDRIEFERAEDDVPVLRGLLGRGVLEHLGGVGTLMFLPEDDAAVWKQAVGARRAGRFVVASADLVLPEFPIGVVQPGEA